MKTFTIFFKGESVENCILVDGYFCNLKSEKICSINEIQGMAAE